MIPLVSICVPNLNARPFLKERFDSILDQTLQDWELFVYDSYSDDGSWEYIQQVARGDKRIRTSQGPREGPYPAWNQCVRNTTGKYVYIATSDDAMAPDFLEKMVAALEMHQDCELAHSPVVIVDHRGQPAEDRKWLELTVFAEGIGDLLSKGVPHIRYAPYDGLLQLTGRMVVLSITQLLIRRSVFQRVGEFSNRWGSVSDFHWEMKAGLIANTVHVPDTWATWRSHSTQATASVDFFSSEYFGKIDEMIRDAARACEEYLPPAVQAKLRLGAIERARDLRTYYSTLREHRDNVWGRRLFQLRQVLTGSRAVQGEILGRLVGRRKWTENVTAEIRQWLESLGLQPLKPCSSTTSVPRPAEIPAANPGAGGPRLK